MSAGIGLGTVVTERFLVEQRGTRGNDVSEVTAGRVERTEDNTFWSWLGSFDDREEAREVAEAHRETYPGATLRVVCETTTVDRHEVAP